MAYEESTPAWAGDRLLLGAAVGRPKAEQCGGLKDGFGRSRQVSPTAMGEMLEKGTQGSLDDSGVGPGPYPAPTLRPRPRRPRNE